MAIPSDSVDESWTKKPKKWNLNFIRKFMITFGILSSLFDFITFGTLIFILKSTPEEFRTGWFMITIWTEFVVLWVLRSKEYFFRSKPGKALFYTTLAMFILSFILPYTYLGNSIDLIALPYDHLALMLLIVVGYAIANEFMKKIFYKKISF